MDITKYTGYFHDGSLMDLKHVGNEIEISMISAQVDPDDMIENMPPLHEERITGKLYIKRVEKIIINDKPLHSTLEEVYNKYDDGEILDFTILDRVIELGIEWTDYPPKLSKTDYSLIRIEANKNYWENIPIILDPADPKNIHRLTKYLDINGNPVPVGHRASRLYSE